MKLELKSKPQFYADDGILIFAADSFVELVENIKQDIKIYTTGLKTITYN